MALRADQLGLELALRRVLLARERGPRAGEGERREQKEPHVPSAFRMPSSSFFRDAGPTMCGGTTRPRRSMKNVSG